LLIGALFLVGACGSDTTASNNDGGTPPGSSGAHLIENYSPPGGGLVWTCPDGSAITLTSAESKQSTICLGIDGSECPGPKPGPGDAQCDDPMFNRFKDTCVAGFFDCFDPTGTCTKEGNGNQTWTNGALQDRSPSSGLAEWIPSAGQPPCVSGELVPGTTTIRYTKKR